MKEEDDVDDEEDDDVTRRILSNQFGRIHYIYILRDSKIEGTPGIIGEPDFYLKRPKIYPLRTER